MLKKERYQAFVAYFSTHNPDAQTELNYRNPYELLVAVILAAQCTDKRINQVTPALCERFPEAESLAESHTEEGFTEIRNGSKPNKKAKKREGRAQKVGKEVERGVPKAGEARKKQR